MYTLVLWVARVKIQHLLTQWQHWRHKERRWKALTPHLTMKAAGTHRVKTQTECKAHSGRRGGRQRQGPRMMLTADLRRLFVCWFLEGYFHHPHEVLMFGLFPWFQENKLSHSLPVLSFRLITVSGNFCCPRPNEYLRWGEGPRQSSGAEPAISMNEAEGSVSNIKN